MNELLLQYIWQHQLYSKRELCTTTGEPLDIVDRGIFNTNQGPDFLNGRIRIADTVWAGHIELHVRASDWNRHAHSDDRNYDNVILHVVWENDVTLPRDLPTLLIEDRVSSIVLERYRTMMHRSQFVPCEYIISQADPVLMDEMITRMIQRRLNRKADHVLELLNSNGRHWEEVLWWMTARSFGGNINGEAFESMARSIPYEVITRHRTQIHQVESLLLGQAGLLAGKMDDDYAIMLQKEYHFLLKKYRLKANKVPVHFLKMRPQNFPSIRLAQLGMLIHQHPHLFALLLQSDSLEATSKLYELTANDYWHYHFRLNEPTPYKEKTTGKEFIHTILLNAVIPILQCYGREHQDAALLNRVLNWMNLLPGERNAVCAGFTRLGFKVQNATSSQALLELKQFYCEQKLCLSCSIGKKLLSFSQPPKQNAN